MRWVPTDKAPLTQHITLKAFYHYVDKGEHLAAAMGTIVDDTIYAIRPDHKWILDAIAAELVFGKIEERSFRFCGREIVQDEEFSVRVTGWQTTLKINEIKIVPSRLKMSDEPASLDEIQQYMSVVGSL